VLHQTEQIGNRTADLNAKSVRRAINVIREYGPDAVRLVGSEITEAGLSARPKATSQPTPEKVLAASSQSSHTRHRT
jgi:hypothetical protein